MMRVIFISVCMCVSIDFSLKCLLTVTMKWLARSFHRTIWTEKHLSGHHFGGAFFFCWKIERHGIQCTAHIWMRNMCPFQCVLSKQCIVWMVHERHLHWFHLFIAFQQCYDCADVSIVVLPISYITSHQQK